MPKLAAAALTVLLALPAVPAAQQPVPATQPTRFAGTWVGTQSWAITNPPPGARPDQPVTLTIEVVDGKITGTLKPFLGGEEGATIVEAAIVGEELQATAIVGRARPGATTLPPPAASRPAADSANPPQSARRGGGPAGWKEPIRIAFTFQNEGLQGVGLLGTADVTMDGVPWMKFTYRLEKKRARY